MAKDETRVPTSWDELFPGRFLKACDLGGKPVTVTISKVYQQKIEGAWKTIFKLQKTEKEFACNRTNGEHMRAMFGEALAKWTGRRITLGEETVSSPRGREPAIRIVGSPDIGKDIRLDIDQGRLQIHRVLRQTGRQPQAQQQPAREPGAEG